LSRSESQPVIQATIASLLFVGDGAREDGSGNGDDWVLAYLDSFPVDDDDGDVVVSCCCGCFL
jgi:hypothetical protein